MNRNPGVSLAAIALGAALTVAVAGCGGGDKGTNPPPGGSTKELNSPTLNGGNTYVHRFFTAATFPYHCTVHPGMTASVTVSAGAPAADSVQAVSITGNTFSPSTLTLPVGGKVTWTNNDGVPHTVTSD
jgi:plastocyanin